MIFNSKTVAGLCTKFKYCWKIAVDWHTPTVGIETTALPPSRSAIRHTNHCATAPFPRYIRQMFPPSLPNNILNILNSLNILNILNSLNILNILNILNSLNILNILNSLNVLNSLNILNILNILHILNSLIF